MKKYIISVLLAAVAFVSCEKYETVKDVNNDFKVNFEAFWNMVNEQYCYLGYKNIDWDAVRSEMLPRVEAAKSEQEFFKVLASALDYLRDGHVAMFSPFQRYVCNTYTIDENGNKYPSNYNSTVIKENYLTERFVTMSGKIYGEIERDGHKFAYIYYDDFSTMFLEVDFKYIDPQIITDEIKKISSKKNLSSQEQFYIAASVICRLYGRKFPERNNFSEQEQFLKDPSNFYILSELMRRQCLCTCFSENYNIIEFVL